MTKTIYFHLTPWGDWNTPYQPEDMTPKWWRDYVIWNLYAPPRRERLGMKHADEAYDAMRYYVYLD